MPAESARPPSQRDVLKGINETVMSCRDVVREMIQEYCGYEHNHLYHTLDLCRDALNMAGSAAHHAAMIVPDKRNPHEPE